MTRLVAAALALAASTTAGVGAAACVTLAVDQPSARLFSVEVGFAPSCPDAVARVELALVNIDSVPPTTASSLTVFVCAANVSTFLALPSATYSDALVGTTFAVQASTWLVSNQNASGRYETVASAGLALRGDGDVGGASHPGLIASCGVRACLVGGSTCGAPRRQWLPPSLIGVALRRTCLIWCLAHP